MMHGPTSLARRPLSEQRRPGAYEWWGAPGPQGQLRAEVEAQER